MNASTDPAQVRLHPHRGLGWGLYGTAAVAVFVVVVLGAVSYFAAGRWLMGTVVTVFGLGVSAFLGLMAYSLVVPELTVSAAGIRGRMPRGARVDVAWDAVTVDVDEKAGPGTLTLAIGDDSVTVGGRSWIGFGRFLLLLGSTPQALDRLTPAALREMIRLLQPAPDDRSGGLDEQG